MGQITDTLHEKLCKITISSRCLSDKYNKYLEIFETCINNTARTHAHTDRQRLETSQRLHHNIAH